MAEPYGIPPPRFRLPRETHIGAVRLQVADLDRSLDYYRSVIGFEPLGRSSGTLSLGPPGGPSLVHLEERRGVRPSPRRGRYGLYHFAILLPDRPSLGRFARHLFDAGIDAGMSDHLVSESFYLYDPDNLGIEVYADRPRNSWPHHGGELLMAVDPLDVGDVMAAGGAVPWTGAPAGTVLGHMHLHVGDLDEASAFYHEALGFDKMVWTFPSALFMAAGGYHHHLGTNTWSPGPHPSEDEAQLLEWELVVPGAGDKAAESLRRAGHQVEESSSGWLVRDPWGTRLRITAP
jgi:catechol 2,3-dioxygenase